MSSIRAIFSYCFPSYSYQEALGTSYKDSLLPELSDEESEHPDNEKAEKQPSGHYFPLATHEADELDEKSPAAPKSFSESVLKYLLPLACLQKNDKNSFEFTAIPITRVILDTISTQFKRKDIPNHKSGRTEMPTKHTPPSSTDPEELDVPNEEEDAKQPDSLPAQGPEIKDSGEKNGCLSCLAGCHILCRSSVVVAACLVALAVVAPFELLKAIPLLSIYSIGFAIGSMGYAIGYSIYNLLKPTSQSLSMEPEEIQQLELDLEDEENSTSENESKTPPKPAPPLSSEDIATLPKVSAYARSNPDSTDRRSLPDTMELPEEEVSEDDSHFETPAVSGYKIDEKWKGFFESGAEEAAKLEKEKAAAEERRKSSLSESSANQMISPAVWDRYKKK